MGCFNYQTLYQQMKAHLSASDDVDQPPPSVKCIFCSRSERVLSFAQLSMGDHIKLTGQYVRVNIGKRQFAPYTHHAIVKGVKVMNASTAELNLIEFIDSTFDSSAKIRETREIRTLLNIDIHIVRYTHGTHPPHEIIRRAQYFADKCRDDDADLKYKVLTCNCEHFCHWCCTGKERCFQAHNFKENIKNILQGAANVGGKILRVALRVAFISADDLSKAAAGTMLYLPTGVLSSLVLIYLIYCIYSHMKLNKDKKNGDICSSCCSRLKTDLWLRFAVYAVTQAGGLVLMGTLMGMCSSNGIVIGALALLCTITIGTMWIIPRLKNKLSSPFKGKKVRVQSMQNIWQGDVISFKYNHVMHDAVVTAAFPDKNNKNKGRITVVHYSSLNIFGRRKVVEEDIAIRDLGSEVVLGHVYDSDPKLTHNPEEVVRRARHRIGETKFGVLSNRSCHFCHWAKVVDNDTDDIEETAAERIQFLYDRELSPLETFSRLQSLYVDHRPRRKHATKTLEKRWARFREEVKPGQVISLHWRWHKAVVINVEPDKHSLSKLTVTVVHYGENRGVVQDTYTFDLNKIDLWIYPYHPLYRFNTHDVIRRAKDRIGEKKYSAIFHNSSHLCGEIVEKDRDSMILDFGEIKPGDAIIFYYWSFKHAAIVTRVIADESKEHKSGVIGIVHYALPNVLSRRTIIEEGIRMDLSTEPVYKMNLDGCVLYPSWKIIERARDRIGEKRFSVFGNTSWDFVQWASVVQTPAIVSEVICARGPQSDLEKSPVPTLVQERLVMPRVHVALEMPPLSKLRDQSDIFKRVVVRSWEDLKLGDIVEYRYFMLPHQGILTEIDTQSNKINVINYGTTGIFAKRTVVEDTLKFNPLRESLKVYRTDTRKCFSRKETVERAKQKLGEQKWDSGNRSWDMCLKCVLKPVHRRTSSQ